MTDKKLLQAMEMEKKYRKLQTNHKAKTEFGYHDKLKGFGFEDTVVYEQAKAKYYLDKRLKTIEEIVL